MYRGEHVDGTTYSSLARKPIRVLGQFFGRSPIFSVLECVVVPGRAVSDERDAHTVVPSVQAATDTGLSVMVIASARVWAARRTLAAVAFTVSVSQLLHPATYPTL